MTPERAAGREAPRPALVAVLERLKITHVLGIPDNTSAPLFDALNGLERPRLVMVTREGEAFAAASGLWLGGASPLVVIQSTGLLESGDALRGTASRMGVPLPIVVTARGWAKMEAAGLSPTTPLARELLVRPDVDSVALLAVPTLEAWGVPHDACGDAGAFADALAATVARARREERPVALLVTGELA